MTEATSRASLPMFPLGSTLLPTVVLPLHVFEPRYQALVADCLAADKEFGVVMIERGSEVGGGDQRADVGVVAQIVDARSLDDGRWLLGCVGTRRIVVDAWLPDDPYPLAAVHDWPEEGPPASATDRNERVEQLRRLLALASELGMQVAPFDHDISADPAMASYQIGALAPLGPFDRQRLLRCPGPTARFAMLAELLAEQELLLRGSLGGST